MSEKKCPKCNYEMEMSMGADSNLPTVTELYWCVPCNTEYVLSETNELVLYEDACRMEKEKKDEETRYEKLQKENEALKNKIAELEAARDDYPDVPEGRN